MPATEYEAMARKIVDELHEYGFGGDQNPATLEAMRTLRGRIAAALTRVANQARREERWAGKRLHDRAHEIAGAGFLNWRAMLQEACATWRAALRADDAAPPTGATT